MAALQLQRATKPIYGSSCWPSPQLLRVAVRQLYVLSLGLSLGWYARGEHWDERVRLADWWAIELDRLRLNLLSGTNGT